MLQIILTIVLYVWMFLVLILLWRQSTQFHSRMQDLQHALIEVSRQDAGIAQKAADAAQKAADAASRLSQVLKEK